MSQTQSGEQGGPITLTICVITHSRPQGLLKLLKALLELDIPDSMDASILVVDNACEERIRDLVSDPDLQSQSLPIRYEQEPERGIVAARNHCVDSVLASDADFLVFIDDDSWPGSPDWVRRLLATRREHGVDITYGDTIAELEPGSPDWAGTIIHGPSGMKDGDPLRAFYTSNLLVPRYVLETVRPAFDKTFAMTGGSDYHFALKCLNAGYTAAFCEANVCEDFPLSRTTLKWFLQRGFRSGSNYSVAHMLESPLAKALPHIGLLMLARAGKGVGLLLLALLRWRRRDAAEGLFRLASACGTAAGVFGFSYQEYATIHGK